MNDALVQKIVSLQRCVARAREAHAEAGTRFQADQNLQDAAVLNHQYQELNLDIVEAVIRTGLDVLLTFADVVRVAAPEGRRR